MGDRTEIEPWREQDALGSFHETVQAIGECAKADPTYRKGAYFGEPQERPEVDSDYATFLANKQPADPPSGIPDPPSLDDGSLKQFQAAITRWALRRGRGAIFSGTGTGKTRMQLKWARTVADHVRGPVLGLCPLAVAEQTIAEATEIGVNGVSYAQFQGLVRSDITLTNYERFENFDISKFAGIFLDESGIIKNEAGHYRALLTEACRKTPWRLCCTATPSPNDYTELGQHSEFLGVMNAKEMLAMFFVHDGSIRAGTGKADDTAGSNGWRLKRHAEKDFWRWLASWAVVVRHPADLGFADEAGYGLPPLNLHQVVVAAEYKPTGDFLFPMVANTMRERIGARRDTANDRVTKAVEIVMREPAESWLIWCNLNIEADAIERELKNLFLYPVQVAGKDKPEIKVERLFGFAKGQHKILVSKPKIAGYGMNLQVCSRMIFVGLTDSFEQVYQAIRRCWRFGQMADKVDVYFVASELEGAVVTNLRRKERAYDQMLDMMAGHMRELQKEQVFGGRQISGSYDPKVKMELPEWL